MEDLVGANDGELKRRRINIAPEIRDGNVKLMVLQMGRKFQRPLDKSYKER